MLSVILTCTSVPNLVAGLFVFDASPAPGWAAQVLPIWPGIYFRILLMTLTCTSAPILAIACPLTYLSHPTILTCAIQCLLVTFSILTNWKLKNIWSYIDTSISPAANTSWEYSTTNMNTWHISKYKCEYKYTHLKEYFKYECKYFRNEYKRLINQHSYASIKYLLKLSNISIFKNKWNPFNFTQFNWINPIIFPKYLIGLFEIWYNSKVGQCSYNLHLVLNIQHLQNNKFRLTIFTTCFT